MAFLSLLGLLVSFFGAFMMLGLAIGCLVQSVAEC